MYFDSMAQKKKQKIDDFDCMQYFVSVLNLKTVTFDFFCDFTKV